MEIAGLVSRIIVPQFEVIGTVYDGQAAVTATLALNPDVLITDIILPVLNGIEVVRRLISLGTRSKALILTAVEDAEYVDEALRAGASGYVFKRKIGVDLSIAITEALAGRIFNPLAG
jgi:DNA-binding NarL/FixJ family response regulator